MMNPEEQALVAYLNEIKPKKIGFVEFYTDVPGWCVDIHLDRRYDLLAPECIFDECSDAQAKIFLEAFLAGKLAVSWSVSEQLSKLLSTRGLLVREAIDSIVASVDWSCCGSNQLFLGYLALRNDGPELAAKLLDTIRDDFRDGLFLACHRLQDEKLDRKLMAKFVEWEAQGDDLVSTGCTYALEQFIAKWLKLYPYRDLEAVIKLYFSHRGHH
jgi:hypothetical protein